MRDWFIAHCFLLLTGLAGALITALGFPRLQRGAADKLSQRPGASLLAGLVTALSLLLVLGIGGVTVIGGGVLARVGGPFTAFVAVAAIVLLLCGWSTGMHAVGAQIALRRGRPSGGSFYSRCCLGAAVFLCANLVLGAIHPSARALGLVVELALALQGVGAFVLTAAAAARQEAIPALSSRSSARN